jgi:peptidoglycan hydrolase-like protein with peptidoglycan-binding domain
MKSKNIEVEGNEFLLESKEGHYAVIPAKDRSAVMAMIGCDECINSYIQNLPKESDYAEDGTLLIDDGNKTPVDKEVVNPEKDVVLNTVEVTVKAPRWLQDKRRLEQQFDTKFPTTTNEYIKTFRKDIESKLEADRVARKNKFVETNLTKITSAPDYNLEDDEYDKKVLKERNTPNSNPELNIDKVENLESISKEDTKKIQQFLVDNEYLASSKEDINNFKSKDQIINLQKKLKSSGYDLGTYGANKDGIDGVMGSKTLKAFQDFNKNKEIDGVAGPKTQEAFRKYKEDFFKESDNTVSSLNIPEIKGDSDIPKIQTSLKESGYLNNRKEDFNFNVEDNITIKKLDPAFRITKDENCTSEQCTYFVGQEIQKKVSVKGREEIGAYGDAWTIIDNMKAAGNTEVFNVFPKNKASVTNPDKFMEKVTKDKLSQLNESDFEDGDVIGLYYGGSPSTKKAYEESNRTFSTHTGIVKLDSKGNKFIEHNVSGKIFREPIEDYLKDNVKNSKGLPIRVTSIIRPNYNRQAEGEVFDSTQYGINFESVSNPNTALGKKEAAIFGQFLVDNKETIQKDFPINSIEYDKLAKAAKVIGWKESYFQSNPKTKTKELAGNIREMVGLREASTGYTQLKDEENFDPEVRNKLGITNETLKTPQGSALSTIYALNSRYLAIKNNVLKMPESKFTTDELVQLSLLSWNEPLHKVLETIKNRKSFKNVINAYEEAYGKNEKGESNLPYSLALTAYNNYIKE